MDRMSVEVLGADEDIASCCKPELSDHLCIDHSERLLEGDVLKTCKHVWRMLETSIAIPVWSEAGSPRVMHMSQPNFPCDVAITDPRKAL